MRRLALTGLLALATLLAGAPGASAADVGVRGGYYTDLSEPFLGVEVITGLGSDVWFNPNLEYVFVEGGRYLTVNADFHYDFHTRSRTMVWAGAGLGLLSYDPEGSGDGETDLGVNLLAGVGRRTSGGLVPYLQGKLIVNDGSEFVIAVGLRF